MVAAKTSTTKPAAQADQDAAAVAQACRTVALLRAPGGCTWDAEQTHVSRVPYMFEEAAEAAAAARGGNVAALQDELGDVLLQVLLHAEIGREANQLDLASIADNLTKKLVRRHPHIFAGASAKNEAEAVSLWEAQKAKEAPPQAATINTAAADVARLRQLPSALPALQRSQKVAHRVAKVGFDWPDVAGPMAKLDEEVAEVKEALAARQACPADDFEAQRTAQQALADEIGDTLFSLVNLARHCGVSAEETLHRTVERFTDRFAYVEAKLAAQGQRPSATNLDLMTQLWQQAKQNSGHT